MTQMGENDNCTSASASTTTGTSTTPSNGSNSYHRARRNNNNASSNSNINSNSNRGPKHHAAMMMAPGGGAGGGSGVHYSVQHHHLSTHNHNSLMDSLHNDELPCCRLLQEIAHDILPPIHLANKAHSSSSSQSPACSSSLSLIPEKDKNHDASVDTTTANNKSAKSAAAKANGHKQLPSLNIPNSHGFVAMMQEYLWNQYQERRQQQHLTADSQLGFDSKLANKKKRKKKKKKKPKTTSTGFNSTAEEAYEDMEEGNIAGGSENGDEEFAEREGNECDITCSAVVAPSKFGTQKYIIHIDNSKELQVESGSTALVNEGSSQADFCSNLSRRHYDAPTESGKSGSMSVALKDRDWWIHCYLDRVAASVSQDMTSLTSSSSGKQLPGMREFLNILSERFRKQEVGGESTFNGQRSSRPSKITSSTNQPPAQKKVQQHQSPDLYIHVSQKDLERNALRVECFSCRSRVSNLLSNFSTIPLLSLDEMHARRGDGRRGSQNSLSSTALGTNGTGYNSYADTFDNDDEGDDDRPFDYVAMEEGNAVQPHLSDDAKEGAVLYLQAVKTGQGQTVGWRIQKKSLVANDSVSKSIHHNDGEPRTNYSQSNGDAKHQNSKIVATESNHDFQFHESQKPLFLSEEDFSFLLREFFLLPAISYDTWVGACDPTTLSAEKVKVVTDDVEKRYSYTLQELTDSMKQLLKQQEKLDVCERQMQNGTPDDDGLSPQLTLNPRSGSENSFDVKSHITLGEIDADVCQVLEKLMRTILQITHAYQDVMLQWNRATASTSLPSSSFPFQRFPSFLLGQVSSISSLWSIVLNAHGRILEATATFERGIFQLADRQGVIKPFFMCWRSRRLLADVVQAKIMIILNAIECVRKKLDQQKDAYHTPAKVYRPTFLRSVLTQQILLKEVRTNVAHGQHFSGQSEASKELKELNEACEDVLHEIRESWTALVRESSISHLEETYERRREKLERILATAKDKLDLHRSTFYSEARARDDGLDADCFDEFLIQISKNGRGVSEILPVLRSGLVPTVEAMVRRWIIQSTASFDPGRSLRALDPEQNGQGKVPSNRNSVPPKPLIMPLRLIQWMSSEPRTEIRSQTARCPGADGSLRATCLIMTLMYGWFVEQYNEWQAELAQQELLLTMGGADTSDIEAAKPDTASPTTGASKKKPKKKRGKTQSATIEQNSKQQDHNTVTTFSVPLGGTSDVSPSIAVTFEEPSPQDPADETIVDTAPLAESLLTASPSSSERVDPKSIASGNSAKTDDAVVEGGRVALVDDDQDSHLDGNHLVALADISGMEAADAIQKQSSDLRDEISEAAVVARRGAVDSDIGVVDGSRFVPGRTFLLQRLLEVLEGGEYDDGFPIVHL
ncbi:hypothetical protein ACA910_003121 [Epithemia clementina (nom. ined.)]